MKASATILMLKRNLSLAMIPIYASRRKSDTKPGTYTVTMTQDTGPLAGTIEGKMKITIQ